jgi:hypothetical protein
MTIKVESTGMESLAAPVVKAEAAEVDAKETTPVAEVKASAESADESGASEKETDQEETEELKAKAGDEDKDSDDQSDDDKSEDKPKKSGKGFKKKIDKLVKQRAEAQRETEYWKSEALKHAQGKEQTPKQEALAPKATEGKPVAENYDSHAEFIEALTDWKTDQKLELRDRKAKESEIKTEVESKHKRVADEVRTRSEENQEFADLMEENGDVPLSVTVEAVILDSDEPAELMHELLKDRKELQRICSLSAIQAAKELGKIEARLAKDETSKETPKKTTKAPPPISPLGAKSSGVGRKSIYDADKMSQREYEEMRRAQMAKQA